jgi:protein-tyrosine phosphatase
LNANPKFRSILVLCEGNHCRSPIAEALLALALPGCRVESAGLGALEGVPAHAEVLKLMNERGMDLSTHLGRQVTPAMGLAADLIFVMDDRQKRWCESLIPSVRGRVFLLGHWLPRERQEIPDPFRKGPEAFQAALEQIA